MCISSVKKIKKWITKEMKKTLLWEEEKVNLFLIPGGQSNLLTEVKGVLIIE